MALAVHAASGSSYAQGLLQENAGTTHERAMLNTRKGFILCLSLRELRTLAGIWRALLLLHNECDVQRDRTIISASAAMAAGVPVDTMPNLFPRACLPKTNFGMLPNNKNALALCAVKQSIILDII
jgi:acetyl esterase/lipase